MSEADKKQAIERTENYLKHHKAAVFENVRTPLDLALSSPLEPVLSSPCSPALRR